MTNKRRLGALMEPIIEGIIRFCGISAILFVLGIFFFVFREGADFLINKLDVKQFLTSIEWYPDSPSNKRYGILALMVGTASVTVVSMMIAVPFGVGAAIFISEFCGPKLKRR
jgi:phosphate transport system permease protein